MIGPLFSASVAKAFELLGAWVGLVQKLAPWIIAVLVIAAALGLDYTVKHLGIFTDPAATLSKELPFRQSYEKYRKSFPQQVDMILAVVDGATPERADQAVTELAGALRKHKALFTDIYQPDSQAFFRRNALLYLKEKDLEDLADRLARAQPLIGLLTPELSLSRLEAAIEKIVNAPDTASDISLRPILVELATALEKRDRDPSYQVSWRGLITPEEGGSSTRRFLFLKPKLDFTEPLAAEPAINAIRTAIRDLKLTPESGVRVRLTGDAALSYDEITTAMRGMEIAAVLALIMVTAVLIAGLRSTWLVLATLANLVVGLALTATFAAVAVGHLNLISVAFAVLYIGLGVDYSIHLALRYRERVDCGQERRDAAHDATVAISGSLFLCAMTTATGFFSFLPTSFTGIAELGLISGIGMFINLFLSMTLLPAILTLLPMPARRPRKPSSSALRTLQEFPGRHARAIRVTTLIVALGAVLLVPDIRFDRNPLNLRPSNVESVATLRELMAESKTPLMNITVLAKSKQESDRLVAALRALPEVRDVVTIDDLAPDVTERKLEIIDDLGLMFGPSLDGAKLASSPNVHDEIAALRRLRVDMQVYAQRSSGQERAAAMSLAAGIGRFIDEWKRANESLKENMLKRLRVQWLGNLPAALRDLRDALQPTAASGAGFPEQIRRHWISPDGMRRIAVYPRDDINDNQALRRFVESVQSIVPQATGEPVFSVRAGDAIVTAFRQALMWALIVITGILVISLRDVRATLLIIGPLLLAATLTIATMVLFKIRFNFANVIALPLLFGVGVDNGIHMVQRAGRLAEGAASALKTGTTRAIIFSTLTTMCGFGNLLFSRHPGAASMGLVLTIGMAVTLVCTLVVLPAFLRGKNANDA